MGGFKAVYFHSSLLLILLHIHNHISGAEEGTKLVTSVDVHAAATLLRNGHLYLDVRTEEEFEKGHLKNSLNIPYMLNTPQGMVKNPKFMDQVLFHCGKEDHLVVGCRSGIRSLYAAADLINAEFKHVRNMEGGYIAWIENGFAVAKPPNPEL